MSGEPERGTFRFRDNAMFKLVMRDQDICKGVIERVIGMRVDEVGYLNTEQEHTAGARSKTVRMDAYVVESAGRLYDVEMQVGSNPKLPLRFRGYQSILDAAHLKKGQRYSELKESWIVFICTADPFGLGLPVYTIGQACAEAPGLGFDCRAHWLALNASAYGELGPGDALGNLLRYVSTDAVTAGDELVGAIDAAVRRNNGEEWIAMLRDPITEAAEDAWVKGEAEGEERGREEGREEALDRYARLADVLLDEGRIDDLKAANSDPRVRERLFGELGI